MKMLAYGMNANVESMAIRAPTAKFLGKAKLEKHKLVFKMHADIEQSDNDMLGVLWDIDEEVLQLMDMTEGYPVYYNRKVVDVVHNGQVEKAWVYFMNNQSDYCLPSESYYELVRAGYFNAGIGMGQLHLARAECTLLQGTV